MKQTIKKIINPTNLIILIFGICFFCINKGLMTTDDEVYRDAFNSIPTFLNWLSEFYKVWGGRITSMVLTNIFATLPIIVFRISNSIVFIITILASYKIITIVKEEWNEKLKKVLLVILFCSIFFINIKVLNTGAIWVCGATVYLWPLAAMLVALIPFISELTGKKIGKQYYVFAIIANIVAAFAEQTSAILIAFGAISLIWCKIEKRKISKTLIAHYIIIIVLSLVNLLAPGNSARSYSEGIKWYPSFGMLTLLDKLVQGYIQLENHLTQDTRILFSIIAILSSVLIITDKKAKKINKCVAILPIIYVIIMRFYVLEKFGIQTLYSMKNFAKLVASSFIIILVAAQLVYTFKNKKEGIITSILYCASLCSALAISISPTVYASGNRVFTVTDFLLILVSGILWTEFLPKLKGKWKILGAILITLLIIKSIILYIEFYKTGTSILLY